MFLWITVTYLVSNLLNVIITFWEHIDQENLLRKHHNFYVFSADTVSLFTVLSCALRLPIYCYCKPEIRSEILKTIKWKRKKYQSDMDEPESHLLMMSSPTSVCKREQSQTHYENEDEIEDNNDTIWL